MEEIAQATVYQRDTRQVVSHFHIICILMVLIKIIPTLHPENASVVQLILLHRYLKLKLDTLTEGILYSTGSNNMQKSLRKTSLSLAPVIM